MSRIGIFRVSLPYLKAFHGSLIAIKIKSKLLTWHTRPLKGRSASRVSSHTVSGRYLHLCAFVPLSRGPPHPFYSKLIFTHSWRHSAYIIREARPKSLPLLSHSALGITLSSHLLLYVGSNSLFISLPPNTVNSLKTEIVFYSSL